MKKEQEREIKVRKEGRNKQTKGKKKERRGDGKGRKINEIKGINKG